MLICYRCNKPVSEDWNRCLFCGAKLGDKTLDYIITQLTEGIAYENKRRENLDSKATTYIGFLSIVVTFLLGFGGLVIEIMKNQETFTSPIVTVFSFLYFIPAIFFSAAVFFAFKAYHTGSRIITKKDKIIGSNKVRRIDDVYLGLNINWLINNADKNLLFLKKKLKPHLMRNYNQNHNFNDLKNNNILYANRCTSIAIIALLYMAIVIGLYGVGII